MLADSPLTHAPSQSGPPSQPDRWLHDTSVNVPVRASWPEGKGVPAPPVSSQIPKLLADAAVRVSVTAFRKGRGDALDRRGVLVVRVAHRRPALLLVSLNWEDVRDLDEDGLLEWARVCGGVRVGGACEREATPAGFARPEPRCRPQLRELGDGSSVS